MNGHQKGSLAGAIPIRSAHDHAAQAGHALAGQEVLPSAIEGRLSVWLTLGKELHPLTVNLVVRFARALAAKLADAEKKYGYSDGWRSPDWMEECRARLMEHIAKGDPRDVAAYCAFLWHHGESTAAAPAVVVLTDEKLLDFIQRVRDGAPPTDKGQHCWQIDTQHPMTTRDVLKLLRQYEKFRTTEDVVDCGLASKPSDRSPRSAP